MRRCANDARRVRKVSKKTSIHTEVIIALSCAVAQIGVIAPVVGNVHRRHAVLTKLPLKTAWHTDVASRNYYPIERMRTQR
jgi:uncharacterized membrane protein